MTDRKPLSPRARGFVAGLWSKKIDDHPPEYSQKEVAQYRAGWRDGNDEASLRRKEARSGMPKIIPIKERNRKIVMYTEAAAARRAARLGREGD